MLSIYMAVPFFQNMGDFSQQVREYVNFVKSSRPMKIASTNVRRKVPESAHGSRPGIDNEAR